MGCSRNRVLKHFCLLPQIVKEIEELAKATGYDRNKIVEIALSIGLEYLRRGGLGLGFGQPRGSNIVGVPSGAQATAPQHPVQQLGNVPNPGAPGVMYPGYGAVVPQPYQVALQPGQPPYQVPRAISERKVINRMRPNADSASTGQPANQ